MADTSSTSKQDQATTRASSPSTPRGRSRARSSIPTSGAPSPMAPIDHSRDLSDLSQNPSVIEPAEAFDLPTFDSLFLRLQHDFSKLSAEQARIRDQQQQLSQREGRLEQEKNVQDRKYAAMVNIEIDNNNEKRELDARADSLDDQAEFLAEKHKMLQKRELEANARDDELDRREAAIDRITGGGGFSAVLDALTGTGGAQRGSTTGDFQRSRRRGMHAGNFNQYFRDSSPTTDAQGFAQSSMYDADVSSIEQEALAATAGQHSLGQQRDERTSSVSPLSPVTEGERLSPSYYVPGSQRARYSSDGHILSAIEIPLLHNVVPRRVSSANLSSAAQTPVHQSADQAGESSSAPTGAVVGGSHGGRAEHRNDGGQEDEGTTAARPRGRSVRRVSGSENLRR